MTAQAAESGRTSIAVSWPVRERLEQLERAVAAKENRRMTADATIAWMLDRIDAADLP